MKQSTALDILKTGNNVFLTGQAGAGKTYTINEYVKYLRARNITVALTASTGIAATHMNGMTIHGWSGMGIKDEFSDDDFARIQKNDNIVNRIETTQVLVVDEISMLHAKQVELLNKIMKKVRKNDLPFGGVQIIFSGDFFQLPPIAKNNEGKEKYAFMAPSWIEANFHVCYLTEQYRQKDEQNQNGITLNEILNQIRHQQVDNRAISALTATRYQKIDDNRTRLYTHNANVDEINLEELNKLDAPSHYFKAVALGEKAMLDALKKGVRAAEELVLKVGAKVMFIKNNASLDVYNGTMGEVVGFLSNDDDGSIAPRDGKQIGTHNYPVVRLNSGREVVAEPEEWQIENPKGEILATYSQVPLCLAWAITVHKSQGMTLDAAEMDLSRTFEMGQGYVALSRLRSLDGLRLLNFNARSLQLDEFVWRVDGRLQQLAYEKQVAYESMSDDELKQLHLAFIEKNHGLTDEHKIAQKQQYLQDQYQKQQQKAHIIKNDATMSSHRSASGTQGSTYQETKKALQAGKSFEQVAKDRSLAVSTIVNHLSHIVDNDPDFIKHCQHLKPDAKTIAQVQQAYDTLSKQGEFEEGVKLRPIVEELRGEYEYNDVRLALVFIDKSAKQTAGDDSTQSDEPKVYRSLAFGARR